MKDGQNYHSARCCGEGERGGQQIVIENGVKDNKLIENKRKEREGGRVLAVVVLGVMREL